MEKKLKRVSKAWEESCKRYQETRNKYYKDLANKQMQIINKIQKSLKN